MPPKNPKALIGFLGTSNYEPLHYLLNGQTTPKSRLASRALMKFFPDYEVVIVATKEARKQNWAVVLEEFEYEPELLLIPTGGSEKEIWRILKVLTEQFSSYQHLVLDITHGFRAQPLLAFSAAQLLYTLHHVRIDGIFYAARRMQESSDSAPIFDLAPLLDMVRWSEALSSLKKHGFAEGVADLLNAASKKAWSGNEEVRPRKLQTLGAAVTGLSTALALNRPEEAAEHVLKLRSILPDATRELRSQAPLAPVAPLFQESLKRLSMLVPRRSRNPFGRPSRATLSSLAAMIRHDLGIGAYAQAITLSREALVTRLCMEHNLDIFDDDARRAMEGQLNAWLHLKRAGSKLRPKEQSYVALWGRVVNIRNDINHAGFKKQASSGNSLAQRVAKLANEVADWLEH